MLKLCFFHANLSVYPFCSIYIVHDEVKDKAFELELSWVGECEYWLS